MTTFVADDYSAIAARAKELRGGEAPDIGECETCHGVGWLDQRLGGIPTSGWCECPDCRNPTRGGHP